MSEFYLDSKYNEAVKYMNDPEGYSKEIIVAFYRLYKDMFICKPKASGEIGKKEFIIRKCVEYFEVNKDKLGVSILVDYYFNGVSYKELSKKHGMTTVKIINEIRSTRDAMYYANRFEDRFLVTKIAF